jgi:hypothetical protein
MLTNSNSSAGGFRQSAGNVDLFHPFLGDSGSLERAKTAWVQTVSVLEIVIGQTLYRQVKSVDGIKRRDVYAISRSVGGKKSSTPHGLSS